MSGRRQISKIPFPLKQQMSTCKAGKWQSSKIGNLSLSQFCIACGYLVCICRLVPRVTLCPWHSRGPWRGKSELMTASSHCMERKDRAPNRMRYHASKLAIARFTVSCIQVLWLNFLPAHRDDEVKPVSVEVSRESRSPNFATGSDLYFEFSLSFKTLGWVSCDFIL